MSTQAREALRHLTAALEAHLDAVASRRSAEDASVDDAFDAVAEAFERYEDELDAAFGEALPIVLDDEIAETFDELEDEQDDEDDDDDDEDDVVESDDDDIADDDDADDDTEDDDIEEFDLR